MNDDGKGDGKTEGGIHWASYSCLCSLSHLVTSALEESSGCSYCEGRFTDILGNIEHREILLLTGASNIVAGDCPSAGSQTGSRSAMMTLQYTR